ncbi:extracellular solute-binding protein [Roseibium sp. RKSG952]|uniref:sensor histidine kinase n=1 Tax=Roseibium sp. RKSG952 TaxID=2529384 RepID=UPI0012BD7783|nr:extracellular solute-binding protein [Roseibium sp. RKSG952]MTH96525.1 extracellular solute-binding protein [Roseibium sp. RKSG952]
MMVRQAGTAGSGTRAFSLSTRVGIAMGIVLAAGGVLVMLAAWTYGQQAARETFDRLLVGAANDIASAITVRGGRVVVDTPLSAFQLLALAPDDRISYRVAGPDGQTYTGYETAPLPPHGSTAGPQFYDAGFAGEPARYVAIGKRFAERRFSGEINVIVGQTKRARNALAYEIMQSAVLAILLAGLIMVVLAVFVVRSALRPLQRIGDVLQARDPKDLTPLDLTGPRETVVMLSALNGFMQRIERQLSIMRTLIGDAAHQLRTPVAALRSQAELAADEPDESRRNEIVSRIHKRSVGLSRLLDQLLNHAMITHRADAAPMEVIDLRMIAVEVIDQSDHEALDRDIDVRADLAEDPVLVLGDRLSLIEAAKNLLNNAVTYGRAPVRLVVSEDAGEALLAVVDAGPGPDESVRTALGSRFQSGGSTRRTGAGIGLSIVASVVRAHGGRFSFEQSETGECFAAIRLSLPKKKTAGLRVSSPVVALVFSLSAAMPIGMPDAVSAQEAVAQYGPGTAPETLTIASTTDIAVFEPVIEAFRKSNPQMSIDYMQWGSNRLYDAMEEACLSGAFFADLIISSAVQQMVRLVNDACAQPHVSAETARVPEALNWRDELYGVTREPAVIVYNRDLVPLEEVPRSRFEIIDLLRPFDSRYAGKVATYDIETSGLGYLFAFMDAQEATTFGALLESLARTGGVATCCSSEIITGVAEGTYLVAYNVLGSYAMLRAQNDPRIGVIAPEDYTLVLSRAAMIPKTAKSVAGARQFLDFLLSADGQRALDEAHLNVRFGEDGEGSLELPSGGETALRLIELRPALLVALDRGKREIFISRWRETFTGAMIP